MRSLRRRRDEALARQLAHLGKGSRIAEPVLGVPNPSGVHIGDDVDIRPYAFLEAVSPRGVVTITIGDGTYLGPFARLTAIHRIEIGRKVLIADRCYISDTGHEYEDTTRPIMDQAMRTGRTVAIGDGAWIGVGVAIVGHVTIGRGAVVGANAVVRDDVPDHSVVTGDPARVVRRYVDGLWVTVD